MKVKRNFEKLYRREQDPWGIGAADSERYNHYLDLLLQRTGPRDSILDIGCGLGGFLARFKDHYAHLHGLEISEEAIARGKKRHPFIVFEKGSAARLSETSFDRMSFDSILFSDVIYYLDEKAKRRALDWIATHLNRDGRALIAAWCPGTGPYLSPEEFKRLVCHYFRIEQEGFLESGHVVFLAVPKKNLVAVTIDCETWHPIPPGRAIDWDRDILQPTERLMALFEKHGLSLTLFAEMGEYFWLQEHDPSLASKLADQWKAAVVRGHDVQLHLHPNWLPELGAQFQNGNWHWDWSLARAEDFPGDLSALIRRCKQTLESLIQPVSPEYRVTCYRAGAYQAQPFRRLHDALVENGIHCDSSVYAGGVSEERGYDYSLAWSRHQPYFASRFDPQLPAPPAENQVLELPVFTYAWDRRWFLDGEEGARMARRLFRYLKNQDKILTSTGRRRVARQIQRAASRMYSLLKPWRRWVNAVLPRSVLHGIAGYQTEPWEGHRYFVMIGHSKADLDWEALDRNLSILDQDPRIQFVPLSRMAETARSDLTPRRPADPLKEAEYQVQREFAAIMGDERNEPQSRILQEMVPWDRDRLLDLGCGAGYWSRKLADLYPWMHITGVDYGEPFIEKARAHYGGGNVVFQRENFQDLSFPGESFDAVYADNVLEHAYDVTATLSEIHRVLRSGGVLVAAIPSDGRNPQRVCDNHTWKTVPHEVRERLRFAGFQDIEILERDTLSLGQAPYPPSRDLMMYIKAWKREHPVTQRQRALELMNWVHQRLEHDPDAPPADWPQMLTQRRARAGEYAHLLGHLLNLEGFSFQWLALQPGESTSQTSGFHDRVLMPLDHSSRLLLDPFNNHFWEGPADSLFAGSHSLLSALNLTEPEESQKGQIKYALRRRWEETPSFKKPGTSH